MGDVGSRLGRRLIGDEVVGANQEVFCLAETADEDECGDKAFEHAPLVPRLIGRGQRTVVHQWPEQLYGLFEATNPDQAIGHRQVATLSGPELGR